jgi:hypothetical protein
MKDLIQGKVCCFYYTNRPLLTTFQILDYEVVIKGSDYIGSSTCMEYTAAFEMGRRLAVQEWTISSVVTDRDGKIFRAFKKAGTYFFVINYLRMLTLRSHRSSQSASHLLCWSSSEKLHQAREST